MTLSSSIDRDMLTLVAPRENLTDNVLQRLRKYETKPRREGFHDEEVWTLLFVYGFVAGRDEEGFADLARSLTDGRANYASKAWLEMLPLPPRQGVSGESERNSQIDLMVGDLGMRRSTVAGVEYAPPAAEEDGWVCLVEAKWLHDISVMTANDWERNQLVRVLETALTFQGQGQMPSRIHVALITPALFKLQRTASATRLYTYKWDEYVCDDGSVDSTAVRNDINRSRIPVRTDTSEWSYPDLEGRFRNLLCHWVTYEDLFAAMPDSVFKAELRAFINDEPRPLLRLEGAI